ncbi:carboxy-S-adenosyl-L-methionine synthase CmoA [Ferrimonas balearica]|uniref:carboxy-S-adenosyl-L-methionine synthase CmoA n=1 Tax=Ferrimonas balearica TaxID=44012 RepID=UPI001C977F21|nr:carboxy-S-adenosyl-L-methionine synthase CmoA [Ferrimonas balearica]MBY5980982.1 carboxy-S-adenosyl-L-methionine synthase CmoA [Ferrimonas balearica]
MTSEQDRIFSKPLAKVADFRFDDKVASVFPDMISRSIPGYGQILHTLGEMADKVVQPGTRVYDLGCSLGAATSSIRRALADRDVAMVAVDNSEAMVKRARDHLDAFVSPIPVDLVCADIRDIEIENASMVVLNFTLQFLAPDDRDALLAKIYQGMVPGGLLVVSEKLVFSQPAIHQLLDDLHLDFKRANGYSELEISQKRNALENVMRPDTVEQHKARFQAAGFSQSDLWFQCYNFASMVAIK